MSTHNLLFVFVSMQTFIVPITTEWGKYPLKNHTFTYVFALFESLPNKPPGTHRCHLGIF